MSSREYINFLGTTTYLNVDLSGGTIAFMGFSHDGGMYSVGIQAGKDILLLSDDIVGPIFGFENMFAALHEKLDKLGLNGFPKDPAYVLHTLRNPPAQFKDMGPNGMTVEEYLATLDENGNPR